MSRSLQSKVYLIKTIGQVSAFSLNWNKSPQILFIKKTSLALSVSRYVNVILGVQEVRRYEADELGNRLRGELGMSPRGGAVAPRHESREQCNSCKSCVIPGDTKTGGNDRTAGNEMAIGDGG